MEGHREQPTVYVNHYFREDVTKEDLCTLAAMVLKIQRDSMLHQTGDFEMLLDYEKMKKRIYCRLISRNKNEDLLKTVPWIPWMDLAIRVLHGDSGEIDQKCYCPDPDSTYGTLENNRRPAL